MCAVLQRAAMHAANMQNVEPGHQIQAVRVRTARGGFRLLRQHIFCFCLPHTLACHIAAPTLLNAPPQNLHDIAAAASHLKTNILHPQRPSCACSVPLTSPPMTPSLVHFLPLHMSLPSLPAYPQPTWTHPPTHPCLTSASFRPAAWPCPATLTPACQPYSP